MMATYYVTQRPAGLGAVPKRGLVDVLALDPRVIIPKIGRGAYSKVTYNRELTREEVEQYELTPCEKLY